MSQKLTNTYLNSSLLSNLSRIFILFKKNHLIFNYVQYLWICAWECVCPEASSVRCPSAGVTEGCEPPGASAGNQTPALYSLNCSGPVEIFRREQRKNGRKHELSFPPFCGRHAWFPVPSSLALLMSAQKQTPKATTCFPTPPAFWSKFPEEPRFLF